LNQLKYNHVGNQMTQWGNAVKNTFCLLMESLRRESVVSHVTNRLSNDV